jgi:hypothetical protein
MDLLTARQAAAAIGQPYGRIRRVTHAGLITPAARAGDNANSPVLFTHDQLPQLARICAEHTRYKRTAPR